MPITRTAMIDDDGSGTTGTILNNAWKQELYNQIDAYVAATWVDIPFASATFSATGGAGGVWTVGAANIQTLGYVLNGNTVTLAFSLVNNMPLTATAGQLIITLPTLPTSVRYVTSPFSYFIGTLAGTGMIERNTGVTHVSLVPALGGSLWPAASTMYLMGEITFPRV
jgi:hypothetical protein